MEDKENIERRTQWDLLFLLFFIAFAAKKEEYHKWRTGGRETTTLQS
jgi:hypothetical protein